MARGPLVAFPRALTPARAPPTLLAPHGLPRPRSAPRRRVVTARRNLPREAEDALLLALAAVMVPATWRLLLGWSWDDLIPGHDGIATVFLAIRELVEAHGRWSDLVYRADLFGGMKLRDAVGPLPALSLLARVISVSPEYAVADCGLKALGMDHGNPQIAGARVWFCSDAYELVCTESPVENVFIIRSAQGEHT